MAVVLLILKIIGITLLVILGLVVLILLLVLFVPFRYSGRVVYKDGITVRAEASWLLKVIAVIGSYAENKFDLKLRFFWFFNKPADLSGKKEEHSEKTEEETPEEKIPLKERFEKLKRNLTVLKGMADDERITDALSFLFSELKRFLKHLAPKKLSGHLEYGLSSPYDTAILLSVFATSLPVHKNRVEITPDFDREILDADVKIKGRIFVVVVVSIALGVLFNKNVRYLMRTYKKYFGKKKENLAGGLQNG
ncbi:MAG: DUF2953 domain-containing protein [Lachnospiraceae bacterium]|nr:DUF2953 domain-containing protein [Lachnospiraceae bacterium]